MLNEQLANHLKTLRQNKSWSLDQLSKHTGISRATLSRLENADVSPTTDVLHKLCIAYQIKMSRLLAMIEDDYEPLIAHENQMIWKDPNLGFSRRSISPSTRELEGEIIECYLEPNTKISYERINLPGLEHHIVLQSGQLNLTIEDKIYTLRPSDCLRYFSSDYIQFQTPPDQHAKYYVFLIGG